MRHASRQDMTSGMAAYRPTTLQSLMAVLKDHLPAFLAHPVLPKGCESVSQEVFEAQHWALQNNHSQVGITPFGLPEARLLVSGSYVCAGVKFEAFEPQMPVSKKLEHILTTAGLRSFVAKCQSQGSGFWIVHDSPGSVVVLPAGHVLVMCGMFSADQAANTNGVRWSMIDTLSAQACRTAKLRTEQAVETYPELRGTEYTLWAECLEKFLIPAGV